MKKIRVVCDGSSLGNGQAAARAGAAAVITYADANGEKHHRVVVEYLGEATNNQAEIVAAAIGLEALKYPCDVEIQTDSQYVVKTLTGLFREKKNHEFWRRLHLAVDAHRVKWTWIKGHNNHPIQEECDWAARNIAARGFSDPAIIAEALERVERAEGSAIGE